MSALLSRPLLRRDEPARGSRLPWLAGLVAAGWALVAGLAMSALPGVLIWLSDQARTPVSEPLRIGGQVWLAGHRVGIDAGGTPLRFAPLGLTVVLLLLVYRAARWAAHSARVTRLPGAGFVAGPLVTGYAAGAAAVAAVVDGSTVAISVVEAALTAAGLAALGGGAGVVTEAALWPRVLNRLLKPVVVALRAAAIAVAGLMAIGAVLVAASAVVHSERIGAVARALDSDLAGGFAVALLSAAVVPNMIVWAAAFSLGNGFTLGVGTSVSPGAVELGIVPALPALGALPAAPLEPLGWLVLAGPLAVGIATGTAVRRRSAGGLRRAALPALGAATLAAATMAGLALLSGGSAGAARMSGIGPDPWLTGLLTLVEVGLPAIVVASTQRRGHN